MQKALDGYHSIVAIYRLRAALVVPVLVGVDECVKLKERKFYMKYILLLFAIFSLMVPPVSAKESFVSLEDYVAKAEAIAVCVVEKDNGDGSVTANITEVLKGNLDKSVIIQGETGHCIVRGPVSRFMKAENKYLVFLFKGNIVGRRGGILQIEEALLHEYVLGSVRRAGCH
jgi:hypothetical protein